MAGSRTGALAELSSLRRHHTTTAAIVAVAVVLVAAAGDIAAAVSRCRRISSYPSDSLR